MAMEIRVSKRAVKAGCAGEQKESTMKQLNLQDVFLNQARRERLTITIYLTNGFQFKGVVRGFDSYTVILDCDGRQNLVYKHAISTITPSKPIAILDSIDASGDNAT